MRLLIGFLLLLVAFGCLEQPPEVPEPPAPFPDINLVDQNTFSDANTATQLVDTNSINVDFDFNRISFNFGVDLNSQNLDLNILAASCNVACGLIDANTWSLTKDINFGIYSCICTKEVCYRREETQTRIIKYCSDHQLRLIFTEEKNE